MRLVSAATHSRCRYAGAYGLPENKTTVLQHVAIMTQQHVRAEQGQAVPEEPQYIFASLKQVSCSSDMHLYLRLGTPRFRESCGGNCSASC